MKRDIRSTPQFTEAIEIIQRVRRPGEDCLSDAADLDVSPDGKRALFVGTIAGKLEGELEAVICEVVLTTGEVRRLGIGHRSARHPRYAPDGSRIAFLSDDHRAGDFQLFLLDPVTMALHGAPAVDGWCEYFHWAADGCRILVGLARHGADVSGGEGAIATPEPQSGLPSWMPQVDTGDETSGWRRACIIELDLGTATEVGPANLNVWEAVWCGSSTIAAVCSDRPSEGAWYGACVYLIDVDAGTSRNLYSPQDQLGSLAASPAGDRLAVVDAVCSDRRIVAGDLKIIEAKTGAVTDADSAGVDVTHAEWRSEDLLLISGHRGLETVVGLWSLSEGGFSERWSSNKISGVGRYIKVAGRGSGGDCVFVAEGFLKAPEVAAIESGAYRPCASFKLGAVDEDVLIDVEEVRWTASDGLEIEGLLLRPRSEGPHPLVTYVHGGPVWLWRPYWLGRSPNVIMLLRRGFAVFYPNPRGSAGRGREFTAKVVGDMGGADMGDLLSGIDHLVARGVADPLRLGVSGGSYGGFMTSWLICNDHRFGAAVTIAPHTNQVSEHLLCNIPEFMARFMGDRYTNIGGAYSTRSPVLFADRARTPTLIICGQLDKSTPPEEGAQFHRALCEHGVTSVLVTYPEEGHGIRFYPTVIDYIARTVAWFEVHLRSAPQSTASATMAGAGTAA